MKGDILIISEHHKQAAHQCFGFIKSLVENSEKPFIITVAGESGAGKSEVAQALAQQFLSINKKAFVFQQDDYFILPPKTNAAKRLEDISWVGPQEVKLALLDEELEGIRNGDCKFTKPLVVFQEDRIDQENVDLSEYDIIIAEGTYTTLLNNVDCRIFIDRNLDDTRADRLKRNREKQDAFLEQILTIEHSIISKHKILADIVIDKTFNAHLTE